LYATSSHFTLIISVRVALAAWRGKPIVAGNPGDLLAVARSRGGMQWLRTGVGIFTLVCFFTVAGTFVVVATVIAPASRPLLTMRA
jgi:hypothetical protein